MPIDTMLYDVCIPAQATVVGMRKRRPEKVHVVHRSTVAVKSLSREEAPVAVRFEQASHPHSYNLMRYFDGRLWSPLVCHMVDRKVSPVETDVLKLMMSGTIRHLENHICLPEAVDVPFWSDFKAVLDTGEAEADLRASELSARLVLVDGVAYREATAPSHCLSATWTNQVYVSRQFDRRAVPPRAPLRVMFSLSQGALARKAESRLVELFGVEGHDFRIDRLPIEVLIPEAFAVDEDEAVWLDAVGVANHVGRCGWIWNLPTDLMERWVEVRRLVESPLQSAPALLAGLYKFACALIDGPRIKTHPAEHLIEEATMGVVLLGVRIALADGILDEQDKARAAEIADAFEFRKADAA